MLYPSIDKLLNKVGSKYLLVNIIARRSKEMEETKHYQKEDKDYTSKKNLGRSLEEIADNLVTINKR